MYPTPSHLYSPAYMLYMPALRVVWKMKESMRFYSGLTSPLCVSGALNILPSIHTSFRISSLSLRLQTTESHTPPTSSRRPSIGHVAKLHRNFSYNFDNLTHRDVATRCFEVCIGLSGPGEESTVVISNLEKKSKTWIFWCCVFSLVGHALGINKSSLEYDGVFHMIVHRFKSPNGSRICN